MVLTGNVLDFFEAVEAGRGPPVKQRETLHCCHSVLIKAKSAAPGHFKPFFNTNQFGDSLRPDSVIWHWCDF
jgi:hypothetical protein